MILEKEEHGGYQGDITVSGAIDSLSGNSLTLIADNSITISNPIDLGGGLTLRADGTIDIFADITTASGLRITSGGSTTIASTVRNTNGVGNISIVSDGSIVINGILSTIGTTGSGGNIFLDADGGDITGVGAIVLENPANATGSSLGMQATGDIGVNVSMPLVGSLDPASAIWTPQLAGPPVAADAGGILFIRNLEISTFPNNGISGSAVVAGAANGLGGFRSGGAMTISGGAGNLVLGLALVSSGGGVALASAEPEAGIIFAGPSTELAPAVTSAGLQSYSGIVTLNASGLTVLNGGGMRFLNTINDGSINTTAPTAVPGGVAVTKKIQPTGLERLLLQSTGANMEFEDAIGTALVPGIAPNLSYLSLGPLAEFRTEGGDAIFRFTGTASQPNTIGGLAVNGSTTRPSLYVLGPVTFTK